MAALAGGARAVERGATPRWNGAEGWGQLDIAAALEVVRAQSNPAAGVVAPSESDFTVASAVLGPDETTTLALRLATAERLPALGEHRISLLTSSGALDTLENLGGGCYQTRFRAVRLRGGDVVTLTARVDGSLFPERQIAIAGSPNDDPALVVPSGCSATRTATSTNPGIAWPLALLGALFARSRRRAPAR